MSFPYASVFQASGDGLDGVVVNAWDAARFASAPGFNANVPTGSPDASATTDPSFGQPGAFTIELPTADEYYLSAAYLGDTFWVGPVRGIGDSASNGFVPPPVDLVSVLDTEMVESPPTGPATVDGVAVATDDRVLLTSQLAGEDDGIWVVDTSGSWLRPADWASGSERPAGTLVSVGNKGTNNGRSLWITGVDSIVDMSDCIPSMIAGISGINFANGAFNPGTFIAGAGFVGDAFIAGGPVTFDEGVGFTGIAYTGAVANPLPVATEGYIVLSTGATGPYNLPQVSTLSTTTPVGPAVSGSCFIKNRTGSSITLNAHSGDEIDGASTLSIANGGSVLLVNDGATNWYIVASH